MNRRTFLKNSALLFSASALSCVQKRKSTKERPNIIVMMADDLGYSDLSSYGSEQISTPTLDKLAQEGIRFTDFYAAAPNCSPSRTAMLTGRIPTRVGMYSYLPPETPMHLPLTEITTAKLLRENGYDTAHIGKWHLSPHFKPSPKEHGFAYWMATTNNAIPSHENPENFVRNGKPVGPMEGFSSQLVADEAIHWMKDIRQQDRPFFLNLWFHEPHRKVAAPENLLARHAGDRDAAYFGCIENMDHAISRILQTVDDLNLTDHTVIIFTSDNGSYRTESNKPFREKKSFVWEGGIRAPLIIRWPGQIDAGSTCHIPGSGVDFLPTLCEITGTQPPQDRTIDGTSLVPALKNRSIQRSTPLFWYFYRTSPACAMRQGDWSLLAYLESVVPPGHSFIPEHQTYLKTTRLNRFELFNLKTDPEQQHDISFENMDRFEQMKKQMITLHEEIIKEGAIWF